jgi:hypothetical protein
MSGHSLIPGVGRVCVFLALKLRSLGFVRSKASSKVAQSCNLLYRRFAIGRACDSRRPARVCAPWQNAILRYSRLQICATTKALAKTLSHRGRRLGVYQNVLSLLVFSFSALLVSAGPAAPEREFFREGVNAYRAAQYEAAAKNLRESALLHPASGTYQNLGLSEWQRNQTGPAVLAWEQSLWLDPFNQSAHNNLRFARKVAQIDAPDLSWEEVISTWLPVNWWGWIVCFSLWLAIGAISAPIFLRRPKASWHQGLAAFGLMLFLLSLPAQFGVHRRERIGFVMEKGTALRLTPTLEAQTMSQLAAGEPVRWMRTRGDFLLVRNNRATGWVQRKQLGFLTSQRNGTPTPN